MWPFLVLYEMPGSEIVDLFFEKDPDQLEKNYYRTLFTLIFGKMDDFTGTFCLHYSLYYTTYNNVEKKYDEVVYEKTPFENLQENIIHF